jgi:hypothetical protein
MDSHGKSFVVPALCLAVLALVATSLAGAGALTGCKTAEPARLQVDDATITSMIQAKLAALAAVASLPATFAGSADSAGSAGGAGPARGRRRFRRRRRRRGRRDRWGR